MKKMNNYEAPKAEMIEMQMTTVLMASNPTNSHGTGDSASEFELP